MLETNKLLSRKELAGILGVTENYLSQPVVKDKFPWIRDTQSGRVYYKKDAVLAYFEAQLREIQEKINLVK